jgi:hypothetical protein
MGDSCPSIILFHATTVACWLNLLRGVVMSSVKGMASAIITMHKLGKSVDEIQAMLDASEYRDAKREVLSMVSTYINSITQQQLAQSIRQGETS